MYVNIPYMDPMGHGRYEIASNIYEINNLYQTMKYWLDISKPGINTVKFHIMIILYIKHIFWKIVGFNEVAFKTELFCPVFLIDVSYAVLYLFFSMLFVFVTIW